MGLLRWAVAGLLAALPVLAADLVRTLPGPEGTTTGAVLRLLMALHLTLGLVLGLGLGALATLLGGWTLGRLGADLRAVFRPLRVHRARRAADMVAAPLGLGLCAVLMFALNLRFFAFNNQGLAALLLVPATALALGLGLAVRAAVRRRLLPLAERAGARWPGTGDAPLLWLLPVLGLFLGALVAVVVVRFAALSETWEALTLAPYLGVLVLAVLTVLAEPLTRTRARLPLGLLAVAAALTAGLLWPAVLKPAALAPDENALVHDRSHVGSLLLALAERATDRDHDGFSPRFGHGDCDDADPTAYPQSTEGPSCSGVAPLEDADLAGLEARLRGPELPPPDAAHPGAPPAPPHPSPASPPAPTPPAPTPPAPIPPAPIPPAPTPHVVSPAPEPPGTAVVPPPLEPPAPNLPPQLQRPYNVILITIDTLRADRMGYLGYERPTTPNLDRLAADAIVYERAYSTSNYTPAAVPSIISGRYTSELYQDYSHFIRFDERNTFLAEMLTDANVHTRGILTHWYFEKRKRSGLYQGFAKWTVVATQWGKRMEDASTSEHVSAEAIRQLAELPTDRPYFLWVHFLDPHKWYVMHPNFEPRFGRSSKDRYDHEVAFTDHHVGRLLDAIARHPSAARTAIIVTSDHGEAFGEHGTSFHGFDIYEQQLRVPLLVHIPDLPPRRVAKRVSLIDLAPTILDLLNVRPTTRLQGRSLLPDYVGPSSPQRLIYAERPRGPYSSGMRTLIDGNLKLIWLGGGSRFELYDLSQDPAERQNLIKTSPEATRLRRTLVTLVDRFLDTKGKVKK